MIYTTPHRLSVVNHEALKDASKHWMIVSNKPTLSRDPWIYWCYKLNPLLSRAKSQLRVCAQET